METRLGMSRLCTTLSLFWSMNWEKTLSFSPSNKGRRRQTRRKVKVRWTWSTSSQNFITIHWCTGASWHSEWSTQRSHGLNGTGQGCPVCSNQYGVLRCSRFTDLTNQDKIKIVQEHSLCIKCLDGGHHARIYPRKTLKYQKEGRNKEHQITATSSSLRILVVVVQTRVSLIRKARNWTKLMFGATNN